MITGGWSPRGTAFGGVRSAWISASGRPVPSSASARVSTSSAAEGPIWPPRRSASAISCDGVAPSRCQPPPDGRSRADRVASRASSPAHQAKMKPGPGAGIGSTYSVTSRCRPPPSGSTGESLAQGSAGNGVPAKPVRTRAAVCTVAALTPAPKARATRSGPPSAGRSRYTSTSSTLSKDSGRHSDSATA